MGGINIKAAGESTVQFERQELDKKLTKLLSRRQQIDPKIFPKYS